MNNIKDHRNNPKYGSSFIVVTFERFLVVTVKKNYIRAAAILVKAERSQYLLTATLSRT